MIKEKFKIGKFYESSDNADFPFYVCGFVSTVFDEEAMVVFQPSSNHSVIPLEESEECEETVERLKKYQEITKEEFFEWLKTEDEYY